ncbi:MAG: tRNA (adenosine(37)-N6)-threonylcarbamoyltransferase complex ATPase subunit type 1 TsaE [Fidelibacterota bacterium]
MAFKTLTSGSPEETREIASRFARSLSPGDVVALEGELGSGKTTFIQGLAQGLGIPDVVNSPTFKLVSEYEGRVTLYHLDFYRLESPRELVNLGLDHYLLGNGIAAIEWADRFPDLIPEGALSVRLTASSESVREIRIGGWTPHESAGS